MSIRRLITPLLALILLSGCIPDPTHKGVLPKDAHIGSYVSLHWCGEDGICQIVAISDDRTWFLVKGQFGDDWHPAAFYDEIDLVAR